MNIINTPSPYGRSGNIPKRGIIHAMGEFIKDDDGTVYSAADWLIKCGWSAHLLIHPSGDVMRCRRNDQVAWHAKGYNIGTLGAEFLVPGIHDYGTFIETIKKPYLTDAEYAAGVDIIRREWVGDLGILHFNRHSDVDPARKVDPGDGFPWLQFLKDLGVTI